MFAIEAVLPAVQLSAGQSFIPSAHCGFGGELR